jgi:hypothetical protein
MPALDSDAALARLGDAIARYVRDPVGSVVVMQAAMDYARARQKQIDECWRADRAAGAEAEAARLNREQGR